MSGDSAPAVATSAGQLGIDDWTARATPQDKAAAVLRLAERLDRVYAGRPRNAPARMCGNAGLTSWR